MKFYKKHLLLGLILIGFNSFSLASFAGYYEKIKKIYLYKRHQKEKNELGARPAPEWLKKHVQDALTSMGCQNVNEVSVLQLNENQDLTGITTNTGIWLNDSEVYGKDLMIRTAYHEAAHWAKNHPYNFYFYKKIHEMTPYVFIGGMSFISSITASKVVSMLTASVKSIHRSAVFSAVTTSCGALNIYKNYLHQKMSEKWMSLRENEEKEAEILSTVALIKNGKISVLENLIKTSEQVQNIHSQVEAFASEELRLALKQIDLDGGVLSEADMKNVKNILDYLEKNNQNIGLDSNEIEFNFKDVYPN